MHELFMRAAIQEAQKGKGRTFTNPLVGAVIVHQEKIIATGAHLRYGEAHAEKNAIKSCKTPEKLSNSTIYVTLEPCSHFGKQPPCVNAIIESGIKRVVIGQLDPNPIVSGKGKALLEQHGIEVTTGMLEEEVRQLNPFYNFYFENKRPFITLKQAVSLDGKVALKQQRTSLTGQEANKKVREERGNYQAILVGSETVLIDDPLLLPAGNLEFPSYRVVLDRRGRLFERKDLKIFQDETGPVLIFTEKNVKENLSANSEVIFQSTVTIKSVIEELAKRGVQSIYVEGGATIHDAFLASECWDQLITYIAPKLLGGNNTPSFSSLRITKKTILLTEIQVEAVGNDIRIAGRKA
ncbi:MULTISPECIES: bifunctional diaminohydroxyphosphoribosylaminopyrimidine deaminase/5-amino-6-(5-phosphoribosylamino)uracil reductase RibD [unclassified Enterococcus]|uniref:bifunctional diaminohydroxyphosphoribosylaminopyrimidine deaminase/5-amino-6-(5-phosphoribosylamino)uracil reductase RibD n=1 Tax=unclassified Enterococcus TaxID=2608891 RepID=UPI003D268F43